MASTWERKYQAELEKIDGRAARAQIFLEKYRSWLTKYKGGLHLGFFAAIAQWESDGQMVAGDPELGEYGFYQVAEATPGHYGLPASIRTKPEGNIFVAGLEYNVEAKRLALKYSFIRDGSLDQWLLARLVFAVGRYGTDTLIKKGMVSGHVTSSRSIYDGVVSFVDSTGGIALGSSPPGKIWYRVRAIPLMWQVGQKVSPWAFSGMPVKTEPPASVHYTVPRDVRPYLQKSGANAVAMVTLAVLPLLILG